jgi:AmmeMemoRadiSam system protein B/AmmeMemoRadiSam system protein A
MSIVRQPAVAGTFYPDSAVRLQDFLNEFLVPPVAPSRATVTAVVVPHAGYRYSGETAAIAFSLIESHWERVLLIGPSHYERFHGITISSSDTFRTPLGDVAVDTETCQALLECDGIFVENEKLHRPEHALEVELPFIQYLLPECSIIPMLCGDLTIDEIRRVATIFDDHLPPRTLIVISSDFTHYGIPYDYLPFDEDDAPTKLQELDRAAIDEIIRCDAEGFLSYCQSTGATICGKIPIAVLLALYEVQKPEGTFELLHYTNSGEMVDDFSKSVSYAAIAYKSMQTVVGAVMSEEAEETLLSFAYGAIATELDGESYIIPKFVPHQLFERGAAFVTLRMQGKLRGCMGCLEFKESLVDSVRNNAVNAAFHDPRFPPLTRAEFETIEIHISCLTAATPITAIAEFEIGRHGIIIEKTGHRSVFLPEVAVEQKWNTETTLMQLCRKGGLPEDAWRQDAELSVFETIHFSTHNHPQGTGR